MEAYTSVVDNQLQSDRTFQKKNGRHSLKQKNKKMGHSPDTKWGLKKNTEAINHFNSG